MQKLLSLMMADGLRRSKVSVQQCHSHQAVFILSLIREALYLSSLMAVVVAPDQGDSVRIEP